MNSASTAQNRVGQPELHHGNAGSSRPARAARPRRGAVDLQRHFLQLLRSDALCSRGLHQCMVESRGEQVAYLVRAANALEQASISSWRVCWALFPLGVGGGDLLCEHHQGSLVLCGGLLGVLEVFLVDVCRPARTSPRQRRIESASRSRTDSAGNDPAHACGQLRLTEVILALSPAQTLRVVLSLGGRATWLGSACARCGWSSLAASAATNVIAKAKRNIVRHK